jgi:hypothetical protein
MNREQRRHLHRKRGGELEFLADHCEKCGAPMCPECGEHTDWCPSCGFYHCPGGHWDGAPIGPMFDLSLQ